MAEETENALTLAEAKLSEMQAHLEVARATVAANSKKAAEIAFDAENGDTAAVGLAQKLLADNLRLESDIEHIKAPAVAEATRRMEAARKAAAEASLRQRAEEARAIAMKLEALGAGRDKCFEEAKVLGLEFDAAMNELRRLGAPTPSRELVSVNTNRALDAAFAGLHPEARPVPFLQRHKFVELYRGWANMPLTWASKILNADERRAA